MDFKGRGAQINTDNPFNKQNLAFTHIEGLDELYMERPKTVYRIETPKHIINKVDSPDLGFDYSMNPYQGCEHGCIYCYARNTHTYWGYSAGIDFETKILIKRNAPALLEKELRSPKYKIAPIMLSGNTDCYQPAERKFEITRRMLEVLWKYKHPVSIITKNNLILRDLDILKPMAEKGLAQVSVSITSLNEELRNKLEPRTVTAHQRIHVVRELSAAGIPVNVMVAPLIPGLNDHEIPEILKTVAEAGARTAHYTIVRLNGAIGEIFEHWIAQAFPDRAEKVLNQIREAHGGQLNDSRFGTRMRGEGKMVESIAQLFKISKEKYFQGREFPRLNTDLFVKPGQIALDFS